MLIAIALRERRSADQKGRRERVGGGRVAGDDARAQDAARGPPRARIDHVAVARAVRDHELFAGAAGAKRAVAQPQARDPAGQQRRAQIDRPATVRRADREDAAAAGREEGALDAATAQHARHAIERVALADRVQVQFHAAGVELDATRAAVEPDARQADRGARLCDLDVRRHAAVTAEEAPAPAQRRRRDVEGAVGVRVKLHAALQQRVHLVVHRRAAARRGFTVDPRQLARVAKDRQQRLDAIGFVQRLGRGAHVSGVLRRERHFDAARHRRTMHAQPRLGRGSRTVEVEREEGASANHSDSLRAVIRSLGQAEPIEE